MDTNTAVRILVPDIGDFEDVEVIEIIARPGDEVAIDDPLITLESDKATMEIPAPQAGRVGEIKVAVGDKVSEGDIILYLSGDAQAEARASTPVPADQPSPATPAVRKAPTPSVPSRAAPQSDIPVGESGSGRAHAGPGVRKFARELGVDINRIPGTGPKARILKSDVQRFVRDGIKALGEAGRAGFTSPQIPSIDFAQFGEIETYPLNKIRRLTGQNLHRSWITAPHVTQFDEADITELEAFRKSKIEEGKVRDVKLTLVAFLVKAAVVALAEYPVLNSSLSPDGQSLIYKKYFHIGLAVNTEHGLMVPVIRDVDQKNLFELAREIQALSGKARDRKLSPADMQGGCFTISSLGGIGGTAFTPIINVPEVAILGVSPSSIKPMYQDGQFVPRLMLPYSLSYDHRVVDGAAAARFTGFLSTVLSDIRHLLL